MIGCAAHVLRMEAPTCAQNLGQFQLRSLPFPIINPNEIVLQDLELLEVLLYIV